MIRDARPEDAAALAAILNRAILHSTATFTTAPVDAAERRGWMAGRCVLVRAAPEVEGFAAYGPFRKGEGYARTVEHSIHLAPQAQGHGHGRALMEALIARARAEGMRAMIGAVTAENAGSGAFHAALGFRRVGLLPGIGWKFDRPLDLEFWQRDL